MVAKIKSDESRWALALSFIFATTAQALMLFESLILGVLVYSIAGGLCYLYVNQHDINLKEDIYVERIHAIIIISIVTIIAFFLRLYQLDSLPFKLWHDEIVHLNDARDIWKGQLNIFFTANEGREPLYVYLVAFSIKLFGESNFAVRLPGAIAGAISIPLYYTVVRKLFNRDIALLCSVGLCCNTWHIILSHVAYRLNLVIPIFLCLISSFLDYRNTGKRKFLFFFSVLTVFGIYSYPTFRFVPLIIILYWGVVLLREDNFNLCHIRWIFAYILIVVGLSSPLIMYAIEHREVFNKRWKHVSVFEHEDALKTLVDSSAKTLLMTNYKGSYFRKYNVPDRPVLPFCFSLFFPLGVVATLILSRKKDEFLLLTIWLFFGLLPGMITAPAPRFSRPILALPCILVVTMVIFYLFLSKAMLALKESWRKKIFYILIAIMTTCWFMVGLDNVFNKWKSINLPQTQMEKGIVIYKE